MHTFHIKSRNYTNENWKSICSEQINAQFSGDAESEATSLAGAKGEYGLNDNEESKNEGSSLVISYKMIIKSK